MLSTKCEDNKTVTDDEVKNIKQERNFESQQWRKIMRMGQHWDPVNRMLKAMSNHTCQPPPSLS